MVFETVFVPLHACAETVNKATQSKMPPSQKKARAKATDLLSEEKNDKATFQLEEEVVSSTAHE
jgi:hypothetical protein